LETKLKKKTLILFTFSLQAFLIAFFLQEREKKPVNIVSNQLTILDTPIEFIQETLYDHGANKNNDRLIILFTLEDCSLCLFEAEYWGAAHGSHDVQLNMIGITQELDDNILSEFITEYGLHFPIARNGGLFEFIVDYLYENEFSLVTPIKLFVNSKNELIAIEGPTKNIEAQKNFPERIAAVFHSLQQAFHGQNR